MEISRDACIWTHSSALGLTITLSNSWRQPRLNILCVQVLLWRIWENTGACCTQSSQCEEKNATLHHMLNYVNMTDTNSPVSLPMLSTNSGKGSVFGHNWCLDHGPWLQLSISSPVIAGMHGWRAGIGTVHKMINYNPHDRRGPLKLPARQQAMVLLAFSLYSSQFMVPSQKTLASINGTRASLQFSPVTPGMHQQFGVLEPGSGLPKYSPCCKA